jgi:predicted nucleic acid-binding protein
MVTDFLIGAHAAVRGYTLLTADRRLYSAAFPNLRMKSF